MTDQKPFALEIQAVPPPAEAPTHWVATPDGTFRPYGMSHALDFDNLVTTTIRGGTNTKSNVYETNDAFYTQPHIAKLCLEAMIKRLDELGIDHSEHIWLEPAAGNGDFYKLFPHNRREGLDIQPLIDDPNVSQANFLNHQIPKTNARYIAVSNPPFFTNSTGIECFAERLAKLPNIDFVGIIASNAFERPHTQKTITQIGYHTLLSLSLPKDAFYILDSKGRKKDYALNTTFQLWYRDRGDPRYKISKKHYIRFDGETDKTCSLDINSPRDLTKDELAAIVKNAKANGKEIIGVPNRLYWERGYTWHTDVVNSEYKPTNLLLITCTPAQKTEILKLDPNEWKIATMVVGTFQLDNHRLRQKLIENGFYNDDNKTCTLDIRSVGKKASDKPNQPRNADHHEAERKDLLAKGMAVVLIKTRAFKHDEIKALPPDSPCGDNQAMIICNPDDEATIRAIDWKPYIEGAVNARMLVLLSHKIKQALIRHGFARDIPKAEQLDIFGD